MFFCLLYLLSALSISAVAAYFSVVGLATIFPGSIVSIIIMGGVLEIGKIVTAVWLHRNWKSAPFLIRSYLSFATLVLMGITSMGIFGFLSKAHIEHETITEKAVAMANAIDDKIFREKDYIERQKQYIASLENRTNKSASTSRLDIDQETAKTKDITEQMNKDAKFEQSRIEQEQASIRTLDAEIKELESSGGGIFSNKKKKIETLKKSQEEKRSAISSRIKAYNSNIDKFRQEAQGKIKAIEDKITEFRSQTQDKDVSTQPQIEALAAKISEAHGKVDLLEVEKLGYTDSARQLEAEVGPVKYVAAFIADITGKEFNISQAVRIVIVILVLVFDPLAILLVIAANISIMKNFHIDDKNLNKIEGARKKAKAELDSIAAQILNAKEESKEVQDSLVGVQLKQEILNKEDSRLNSKVRQIETKVSEGQGKLEAVEKELLKKEAQLVEMDKKIASKETEFKGASKKNSHLKIKLDEAILDLSAKKDKFEAEKILFGSQKGQLEAQKSKTKDSISSLERILEQLNSEKKKSVEEKRSLEVNCETLKKRVTTQEQLIKNLKQTYNESLKNGTVKDIFEAQEIDEVVQFLDSGQKLISIPDKNKRIHQFLIPTEHKDIKHQYFHEIVKELGLTIDPDDLPHEYNIEVKKYIRASIPEYNCLT
jgi:DNA repair exonuclease SbcCD ATPase subunit